MKNPLFKFRFILPSILILICSLSTAQAKKQSMLEPVDQAVADLDPQSRSLRQVHTGLSPLSGQTRLFKMPGKSLGHGRKNDVYYRFGSGFVAKMSRMDYLVLRGHGKKPQVRSNLTPRRDGEFRELLPANAVYVLPHPNLLRRQQTQRNYLNQLLYNPQANQPMPAYTQAKQYQIHRRIDRRLVTAPGNHRNIRNPKNPSTHKSSH